MLETSLMLLILVIAVALLFDYINGLNDTANAIATCVSTRALSIRTAVIMAAVLNFVGALASTKVATTIGKDIVDPNTITQFVILAGISGSIIWGLTTYYFAIPSSSSHAIIGGLIGAVVAHSHNFHHLHWLGIRKIVLALIISPLIGIIAGFGFMIILLWTCRNQSPFTINKGFRKMQIVSAAFMAFAHGTADAQKAMGIITMALISYGSLHKFTVPWPVMAACATAMSLGTAIGGWRIIKTVGKDFVKLQPIHGFCVQTAAAIIIITASSLGLPTSTTHIITSSILGVGLSRRLSAINWKVATSMLYAWVFTIPAAGFMSYIIYALLEAFVIKS